jgi:hypothetical protein
MKKYLLALILIVLTSISAHSRTVCVPFAVIEDRLTVEFNESLFAKANFETGEELLIYVGPKSRTFSLVFIPLHVTDVACLFQAGTNFRPAYVEANKKDRDTEK